MFTTCCITPIVLHTKLDAERDKQATATAAGLLLTTLGDGGRAVAASGSRAVHKGG